MRFTDRMLRAGLPSLLLLVPVLMTGCDGAGSSITGMDEDGAAVMGTVAQESASQAPGSAPSAEAESSISARTVVIGEVRTGGGFNTIAEGEVSAAGDYRIEGVPANRAHLTVIARNEAGAEVGRVVLHEETRARAEHRAQPITPATTLHARVWAQLQGSASGNSMGAAELSLFLEGEASTDRWAASEARVNTLAQAAIQADAAISAVLERLESTMDASARGQLLARFAVERDEARATGSARATTQRSFVTASMDAMLSSGVRAEALALAYAAGATAWSRVTAETDAELHSEVVKNALLLNVEARKRAAAQSGGNNGLGMRAAVIASLEDVEAAIRAEAGLSAIQTVIAERRSNFELELAAAVLSGLTGLPGDLSGTVEARLQAAAEAARYWERVEAGASASAHAEAAVQVRSDVNAEVSALLETLPSSMAASASLSTVAELFIAAGAGPVL